MAFVRVPGNDTPEGAEEHWLEGRGGVQAARADRASSARTGARFGDRRPWAHRIHREVFRSHSRTAGPRLRRVLHRLARAGPIWPRGGKPAQGPFRQLRRSRQRSLDGAEAACRRGCRVRISASRIPWAARSCCARCRRAASSSTPRCSRAPMWGIASLGKFGKSYVALHDLARRRRRVRTQR